MYVAVRNPDHSEVLLKAYSHYLERNPPLYVNVRALACIQHLASMPRAMIHMRKGFHLLHCGNLSTIPPRLFYPFVARVLRVAELIPAIQPPLRDPPLLLADSKDSSSQATLPPRQVSFAAAPKVDEFESVEVDGIEGNNAKHPPEPIIATTSGFNDYLNLVESEDDAKTRTNKVMVLVRTVASAVNNPSFAHHKKLIDTSIAYIHENAARILSLMDPSILQEILFGLWKLESSPEGFDFSQGVQLFRRSCFSVTQPEIEPIFSQALNKWRVSVRSRGDASNNIGIRILDLITSDTPIKPFCYIVEKKYNDAWRLPLILQLLNLQHYLDPTFTPAAHQLLIQRLSRYILREDHSAESILLEVRKIWIAHSREEGVLSPEALQSLMVELLNLNQAILACDSGMYNKISSLQAKVHSLKRARKEVKQALALVDIFDDEMGKTIGEKFPSEYNRIIRDALSYLLMEEHPDCSFLKMLNLKIKICVLEIKGGAAVTVDDAIELLEPVRECILDEVRLLFNENSHPALVVT